MLRYGGVLETRFVTAAHMAPLLKSIFLDLPAICGLRRSEDKEMFISSRLYWFLQVKLHDSARDLKEPI